MSVNKFIDIFGFFIASLEDKKVINNPSFCYLKYYSNF
jgi:hypothetical protein